MSEEMTSGDAGVYDAPLDDECIGRLWVGVLGEGDRRSCKLVGRRALRIGIVGAAADESIMYENR